MKKIIAFILGLVILCPIMSFAEEAEEPTRYELTNEEIAENIEVIREKLPTWCEAGYHTGRLYIPAVGLEVGYRYESVLWDWQWNTDLWDTACLFHWKEGNDIIADHKFQGFDKIYNVEVGDVMYLITTDDTFVYDCIDIFDGHNTGWYLTDGDFNSIQEMYDMFIYTCLDWWYNIHICAFELKGE